MWFLPYRLLGTVLAAAALAGCGGGLYIGWGDEFDDPPSVALASAVSEAAPGETVHLAAAASDDYGIDEVVFYRLESDGFPTRLGSDGSAPYGWDVTMPPTSGTTLRFFARAWDGAGQSADSEVVSIYVR